MFSSSLSRTALLPALICFMIIVPCFSILDVDSFAIHIGTGPTAGTSSTVHFTLWWNHTIYEYSINQPSVGSVHTATSSGPSTYTVIGSSLCNPSDHKIRVELYNGDAVIIDKISVNLKDSTWFGVDSFCTPYRYGDGSSYWIVDEVYGTCTQSENHFDRFCVDNEVNDCGPYQQLIHFDLNKPNQWDTTAQIEDGTSTSDAVTTCNPTQSPTNPPSQQSHDDQSTEQNPGVLWLYVTVGCVLPVICVIVGIVICWKRNNKSKDGKPRKVMEIDLEEVHADLPPERGTQEMRNGVGYIEQSDEMEEEEEEEESDSDDELYGKPGMDAPAMVTAIMALPDAQEGDGDVGTVEGVQDYGAEHRTADFHATHDPNTPFAVNVSVN